MKVEIFGAEGCKKCSSLKERFESVVERTGKGVEVEKVTDLERMAEMGIMTTPAVVIDDDVEAKGKMLDEEEIEELIS
ncbi:MAG: thioredoxin family protein [Candidatus Aenigmatarchaeota archaeon]